MEIVDHKGVKLGRAALMVFAQVRVTGRQVVVAMSDFVWIM